MALLVHGGHILNRSYTGLDRADIPSSQTAFRQLGTPWRSRLTRSGLMPPGVLFCLA